MKSHRDADRRSWLLAALGIAAGLSAHAQPVPTVAAAADLKFALEEVAAQFEKDTGQKVRLVFGSSGTFLAQLLQGAPFHLYMSADEAFVFKLADAGKTRDRGRLYAYGRIGIIVPNGSPLKADPELKDLAGALQDGRLQRFAIANPEHAPYGKRAEEALRHQGLWDAIAPNLVYGENVSQAAQFATSANAQGGLIAYSLALSPRVSALGSYALIPEDWYSPLRQRMVLLKNAGPAAERFYGFVQQPAAREIFQKYGFVLPGEPERR